MFAIATYLYARAGEVIALRWEDVDLDRGVVLIHRSFNRETGEVNSTKSDAARRIPIEPELRPLLEAMHGEAGGRGSVVAVRGTDRKLSRQLRRCLALAQVDRPELFAMRDPTRKAMTFHDLRATAITWCAVRGDDPLKIKQRAGHASFSTTEGYIREAENLRDGFGEVFPPLPSSLLSAAKPNRRRVSASVSAFGPMPIAVLAKNKLLRWRRRESNRPVGPGKPSPRRALVQHLPETAEEVRPVAFHLVSLTFPEVCRVAAT